MKKRILSITLILSIVVSLFAVANFGSAAKTKLTAGTDYTLSGYNNSANFAFDPKDNLLNNVSPTNFYWYNVDARDSGDATYTAQPTKITDTGWIGSDHLDNATCETNVPTGAIESAFQMCNYLSHYMFLHYNSDNKCDTMDAPDENMQWVQTNYTLPERSVITDLTLSRFETNENLSLYTPTAYQYILSDTPGGLVSGIGATVIDVNHTAQTIQNVTTVTLSKPVTAKYVAIRMLQPYNVVNCSSSMINKTKTSRWYQWNRFDVHGTKAEEASYTVSGYNNQSNFNLDPKDSLLNNTTPDSFYWYNVDEADTTANGGATYTDQATLVSMPGWTANENFGTLETNLPGGSVQPAFWTSSSLQQELFFQKADGKITSIDTPSEKQWVQANYTLPNRSKITDVTLSCFEAKDTVSQYTPTTYQYIFSDTPGGLVSGVGSTVVTVDHNEDTIKNITTVTLNKPITAKYMAVRMYQHYNTLNPNANTIVGNGIGSRWMKWNRLDVHGSKAEELPYTISGYNNRNSYDVDPTYNLLDDIPTHTAYYYNTDTKDPEIYQTSTPTVSSKDWFQHTEYATMTENVVGGNFQPAFMLCNGLCWEMFMQYDSNGYITKLDTPDVNKQWFQVHYALAAEADISEVILADLNKTDDTISQWAPQSYQYIFADTEEALITGEGATVVNVDHSKDTIKNITKVAFNTPVRAKYVAVRFYQPYNEFSTYNWTTRKRTNLWFTWNRLDLHGQYVNPLNAEVTVATEDGIPTSFASKEDAVYTGPKDNNGKYVAGTQIINAIEYYKDEVNSKEYTFNGWYNGDNLVSATAEYTYDLAGGDVTLTAKYDVQDLVTTYPVNFVDATQKVIKTIQVVEGEYLDPAVVNAIVVKEIYGYTVKRDNEGNVEWNEDIYANPVTAEITYTVQYKALDISSLVTLYKTDSDEYYVHEHYKYDTAIDLVYEGANSWVDGEGVVLVGEPTGRIYASGDRMKIYAKSDVQESPEVAIVGKAHEVAKGFSVFAHVNVEDAEAYGVIYASDNYYNNTNKDFKIGDVTPEGAAVIRVQKIEVSATNIGKVDFMTTLNYSASKTNPTRWARAYVVIDGQYYYSQVVGNKE